MTDEPIYPDAGPCQDHGEYVMTAWSSPFDADHQPGSCAQYAKCVKCGFYCQNQLPASAADVVAGVEKAVAVGRMERFVGLFSRKG